MPLKSAGGVMAKRCAGMASLGRGTRHEARGVSDADAPPSAAHASCLVPRASCLVPRASLTPSRRPSIMHRMPAAESPRHSGLLIKIETDRRLGHEWDEWDGAPLPNGG